MSADYPDAFGLAHETDTYPLAVRRRAIRRYGWNPDHPDPRDHVYEPSDGAEPSSVDLQPRCPPVYNQGALGCCTGNAIAGAIQFERMRQKTDNAARTPSRLFIYFAERVIEGTIESDAGASLRDGIKVVATDGSCFEDGAAAWPYDPARFADRPPSACFAAAVKDEVKSYARLRQDAGDMEACLAEGFPFVFGFTAFAALESPHVAQDGVLPMPTGQPVGGHAVMAVGYDREKRLFKIRNSWGAGWGQQGYFWTPYDYLADSRLASDFWTIRLVEP